MDEQTKATDQQPVEPSLQEPAATIDDGPTEAVGDEPVGPDNIREGKVRGTMHGGPTKQGGQGQGG